MSSPDVCSLINFSELDAHIKPLSFLDQKQNALSSMDFLEDVSDPVTEVIETQTYLKEFNSNVYLVTSRNESSFDQNEAIDRLTTAHIIYNEFN